MEIVKISTTDATAPRATSDLIPCRWACQALGQISSQVSLQQTWKRSTFTIIVILREAARQVEVDHCLFFLMHCKFSWLPFVEKLYCSISYRSYGTFRPMRSWPVRHYMTKSCASLPCLLYRFWYSIIMRRCVIEVDSKHGTYMVEFSRCPQKWSSYTGT